MIVDLIIVGLYLSVTLLIGFYKGKNIKSIEEYAVANKDYSTLIVITTIFATFMGGGATVGTIEKIHSSGIYFGIIFFGIAINMLLLAKYVAPKMPKFQGCISCGDIMRVLYGRNAQIITGVAAFITIAAIIAAQVTAMGYVVHYFTGIDYKICAVISAGVVVLYSAFGGVKAVTITDFFQFWIIIIAIPILCNIGLMKVGGYSNLIQSVPAKYTDISLNLSSFLTYALPYFLVLCMPFQPTMLQRMLIAKDSSQIRSSMKAAAFIAFPFVAIIGVIGLITISLYPDMESRIVLPHLVNEIVPIGFKGIIIAGFLAIIMSTSDSFLNTASVSLVHDTIKPILGDKFDQELPFARIVTFIIGGLSILIATNFQAVIDIMAVVDGVWTSTITVPIFLGILGITISKRNFMLCATSGIIFYTVWQIFITKIYPINSAFMGLIFSLAMFFTLYTIENFSQVLMQPKQVLHLMLLNNPLYKLRSMLMAIRQYKFLEYSTNAVRTNGAAYFLFGVFAVTNYFIPVFMWSNEVVPQDYYYTVAILRTVAGVLCSALIFHTFWSARLKKYLPLYWHFTLLYCLPFMTTFMLFLSGFSTPWLVNLAIALFFLVLLVDWLTFIALFALGTAISAVVFNFAISHISLSQIKIPYDMVYLYIFTILIGGLFSRNKEHINQKIVEVKDAMNAQLKDMVAERTANLKEALSAKQEFLGKVGHEMRTPLQGIIATSQTLHASWKNLADAEKYRLASIVANSGSRLMGLMNNILDLSQFNLGKIKAAFTENVKIEELIENAVKVAESLPDCEGKNFTFRVEIEDNIKESLECDATRITQVLLNLINNAISYSDGGEIIITASEADGKLKISISDNGVGIPDEELTMIFEAFTQSTRTKDSSKGKGLGLAICSEIIGLHHGYIWAENNKNKPGSTFSFIIPCEQSLVKAVTSEKITDSKTKLSGRVLLVDDEDICLQTGSMCLNAAGLEVVTANGGVPALEYLKAHPKDIDIILLDLMMPDIYGLNVLNTLKADPQLKHIPVIIQSGLLDPHEIAKALKLGAVGHISKPYNIGAIHDTIRTSLGQKEFLTEAVA